MRRRLCYIFDYDGQTIISEPEFLTVMKYWSAFSSNDINNDNRLDLREIKMMIWLVSKAKPTPALIQREMNVMDRDNSNSIDRIEWVSYLTATPLSVYQLGNMEYYDFEMRELFDKIDKSKTGLHSYKEFSDYVKITLGDDYSYLDEKRRTKAEPIIHDLTLDCMKELKDLAR